MDSVSWELQDLKGQGLYLNSSIFVGPWGAPGLWQSGLPQ